jgi:hypothetical protein
VYTCCLWRSGCELGERLLSVVDSIASQSGVILIIGDNHNRLATVQKATVKHG